MLYVTFEVKVSGTEYSYQSREARTEVKIQVPRDVLEQIDPGNIFIGAMQAALEKYDNPEEDEAA